MESTTSSSTGMDSNASEREEHCGDEQRREDSTNTAVRQEAGAFVSFFGFVSLITQIYVFEDILNWYDVIDEVEVNDREHWFFRDVFIPFEIPWEQTPAKETQAGMGAFGHQREQNVKVDHGEKPLVQVQWTTHFLPPEAAS